MPLLQRLLALLRGNHLERELNEEIGIHLAMQEEEFRSQGMDPADAHAAALREFGGVAQAKEDVRDRRGVPWLESAARDLRYGLRGLRRTAGLHRRRRPLARPRYRRQYRHLLPLPHPDAAPPPGRKAAGTGEPLPHRRLGQGLRVPSPIPGDRQTHRSLHRRHRPHRRRQDPLCDASGRPRAIHPARVRLRQLLHRAGRNRRHRTPVH